MTLRPALAVCLAATLSFGLAPQTVRAGNTQTWDDLSTGLALGVGGAAAITTLSKSDGTGLAQGMKTAGTTVLAVEALKALVPEQRPDGSDDRSFPSEHTALAFAAATYFDVRYGQEYRAYVPVMYGLAALTGVARVQAKKHFAKDVIAGAVVGFGIAHVFTTPDNSQVALAPAERGVSLTYTKRF